MTIRTIKTREELIEFVLENTSNNYDKLFTENKVQDILYFENYDGELKDNITKFRREFNFPCTILLSEELYDNRNFQISNGILEI
jgi:hypothetical protein